MKDNYCVIMGGGIGSRFWPFSRESYPKQFLDFFGTGRSLLQMTFDRFSKIIPIENIYIVTNEQYASLVKEQLPELGESQILLEPARRNTAPCIAYAAYHIKACNPNANIVVAPSDHLILKEDVFLKDVQKSLDFVKDNNALVTLGIKPSRPETGYGYIQSSDIMLGEFTKVKTFTEKPDLELAKVFMESGEFFWNSGLFVWNVNAILEAFSKFSGDMDPVTALTIDKGQKNARLLVQPQYSPMPVEKQIAILYCGIHGLLRNVPLDKVEDFEAAFLNTLALDHQADVLDVLKTGVINDEVTKAIEETAAMVAKQYS